MKNEIELAIRDLWTNHRASTSGVVLGAVLAVLVLVFGFWNMIFVVVCACVGLFIGKKMDDGEDVLSKTWEFLKEQWKRG